MLKYLICISYYLMFSMSMFDYGEFDIKLARYEPCNGPKRKNCTNITVEIVNDIILKYDILVKEDMKAVKGKISGSLNKKELLKLHFKNMCDHTFLKLMIQSLLNTTDACGIFKGHYIFNADILMISRNFYGGKFMYGNWTFKMLFYNGNCNMHCAYIYLSMTPRNSTIENKCKPS